VIRPEAIAAWREAALDLGIEIVAPYEITDLASGETIECIAYVREFGSQGGTIVVPQRDHSLGHIRSIAKSMGVFCSLMSESGYAPYRRDLFLATLNDWGWFGDKDHPPTWYTGQPWC
jgi:hypothetical protein